jgi:UDP-glucose 4,6-dehydratase
MRVLVTGGCGFIGSNFVNHFLDTHQDAFVVNVDRLDYCANVNNINQEHQTSPRYVLLHTDINNKDIILEALNEYQIEYIIHFAAQSHVDNSFGNSLQFTVDNVLGTHTLLECSKVYGKLKKFVHISTDETYGEVDKDHEGCTEKSLLNPTNPYAATKASAEFLVRSYYYSFGLPIVITRGNNVFGPRQYPEKLIPKFIKCLLDDQKCPIHGKGETRRNFIFVDDVSRAVELLLLKGKINEIYNIGCDDEYSVMEILTKLTQKIKGDSHIEKVSEYVEDRAFNDFRYCINSDKLKALGWTKQIDFESGLNSTIAWYSAHL